MRWWCLLGLLLVPLVTSGDAVYKRGPGFDTSIPIDDNGDGLYETAYFPQDYDGDGTAWVACDCGGGTTPGPTADWICGKYVNHETGAFVDGSSDDGANTHPSCRFEGERVWDDAQDDLNTLHGLLQDGATVNADAKGILVFQGYDRNEGTDPTGFCWNSSTKDYTGACPFIKWSDGTTATAPIAGAVEIFRDGVTIDFGSQDENAEQDYRRDGAWILDNRGEFESTSCRMFVLGTGGYQKNTACIGEPAVLHASQLIRAAKVSEADTAQLDASFPLANPFSYNLCVCNDKDDAACTDSSNWGAGITSAIAEDWSTNVKAGDLIAVAAGLDDGSHSDSVLLQVGKTPTTACGFQDISTTLSTSASAGATFNANGCSGILTNCLQIFAQTAVFPVAADALAGYWVEFTSGVLNGQRFLISFSTSQRLRLSRGSAELPAGGDSFRVVGGCTTADDCGIEVEVGLVRPDTAGEVVGTSVSWDIDPIDQLVMNANYSTVVGPWRDNDDAVASNVNVTGGSFAPQDWLGSSEDCEDDSDSTGVNADLNPGNDGASPATVCTTSCGPMAADASGDPGAPTPLTCDTGSITALSNLDQGGFRNAGFYYGSYDAAHGSNTWLDGMVFLQQGGFYNNRIAWNKHGTMMDLPGGSEVIGNTFAYNTDTRQPVSNSQILIASFGQRQRWENNLFLGNAALCASYGGCPLLEVGFRSLFANNTFSGNRGSHIALNNEGSGAIIRGNVFEGGRGPFIFASCAFPATSHYDRNADCSGMIIQGNTFGSGGFANAGQDDALGKILIEQTAASGFGIGNLLILDNFMQAYDANPGYTSSGGFLAIGDPTCADVANAPACTSGSPQDEMPQVGGASDGYCDATCAPKQWFPQDCLVGFADDTGADGLNDANRVSIRGNFLTTQGKLFCDASLREVDNGGAGISADGYPITGQNNLGDRVIQGVMPFSAIYDTIAELDTLCTTTSTGLWNWAFPVVDAFNAWDCGEADGGSADNLCVCLTDGSLIDAW